MCWRSFERKRGGETLRLKKKGDYEIKFQHHEILIFFFLPFININLNYVATKRDGRLFSVFVVCFKKKMFISEK